MNKHIERALVQALERRQDFAAALRQNQGTFCFRGVGEGEAGFDLDIYGLRSDQNLSSHCVPSCVVFAQLKAAEQLHWEWHRVAALIEAVLGLRVLAMGSALKQERESKPLPLLLGTLPDTDLLWTSEFGVSLRLELTDVLNPGVFIDQRLNREQLKIFLSQRPGPVLNLFSYTGAFSLLATSNGCHATSVDVSKRYLTWEAESQARNATQALSRRVPEDSRRFLTRASRRLKSGEGEPYSWIIIDPPTFSRSAGVVFKVRDELGSLVAAASEVLAPSGGILVSTNDKSWPPTDFQQEASKWAKRHGFIFQPGQSPEDFQWGAGGEVYPLKSAWLLRNV